MLNAIPEDMTKDQRALAQKYLAYQFLSSLFFISAVWLYFYRLYISDAQTGVLDSVAFFIGVIAEVPSGALADRFGRGRFTRLGLLLTGGGFLFQAFCSGFLSFLIGQSLVMIGVSFTSGADEALFFSRLNFDRHSLHWRRLVTRGSQLALIGSLAATLLGGWLHTIHPRLPWILCGLSFICATGLIWHINDTEDVRKKLSAGKEIRHYFTEIKEGFTLFLSKELFCYLPFIVTVQALFYTTEWGLLRIILLDRFHFDPLAGSILLALCNLTTVALLSQLHRHAEKINEKQILSLIAVSTAASLLFSIPDIGHGGFIVILVLYSGGRLLYPFLSEILHKQAHDGQRATVLSIASFLKTLPYVALAPLIGTLSTQGNLDVFFIAWPLLIGAALIFYLSQKKRAVLVSLTEETVNDDLPRHTPS